MCREVEELDRAISDSEAPHAHARPVDEDVAPWVSALGARPVNRVGVI